MTAVELRACSRKVLEDIAKRHSIGGRHAMRKEELVRALVTAQKKEKRKASRKRNGRGSATQSSSHKSNGKNGSAGTNGKTATTTRRNPGMRSLRATQLDGESSNGRANDRIRVQVLNAYWLKASWRLSQRILDRAQVALGIEWHRAVPVIRVFNAGVSEESSGTATRVNEIEIHGNVDHWYIPVEEAPCSYTLQIGYRTPSGRFFALARSNKVTTPDPGSPVSAERTRNGNDDTNGKNGSSNGESTSNNGNSARKPLIISTARVSTGTTNGNGKSHKAPIGDFEFQLNTELIIHGTTHPDAELTLLGDPVRLDKSGAFTLRMAFPEGRQVIPAVATTPDGEERRTIVVGVERNTKELEPQPTDEPLL